MARIRSIKPEFFEDEKLAARCSVAARLLYVGLWVFADDDGRMRASPAYIKASVFPYDELITLREIKAMLDELAKGGFVELYEASEERLLWIKNFRKHQKIDKAKPSRLPAPPSDCASNSTTRLRRVSDESTTGRRRVGDGSGGGSGSGMEEEVDPRATARDVPASPASTSTTASPVSVRESESPHGSEAQPNGSVPPPAPCPPGWEPLVRLERYDDGCEHPPDQPMPWAVPWFGNYPGDFDGLEPPTPEQALWSYFSARAYGVTRKIPALPSSKHLRRLRTALEQHGPEPMRKAWLCWLVDPWAATRSPPFALGAFLADDQLAQMLDRSRAVEWRADETSTGDWELPETGAESES